jgi:hypothetical protein
MFGMRGGLTPSARYRLRLRLRRRRGDVAVTPAAVGV